MEKLITVSGPRGAGKETIVNHALGLNLGLSRVVPFTTRAMRKSEQHGREYYFISKEEFFKLKASNDLFYWGMIGNKDDPNHYFSGTQYSELQRHKYGIIDITVEGALLARKSFPRVWNIFVFAEEDERLQRVMTREDKTMEQARILLSNEPSPALDFCDAMNRYKKDFSIISNFDDDQQGAFDRTEESIRYFMY